MAGRGDIRRIALGFPEAVEADHHGIPSFRVNKKIFCTIHMDRPRFVLKLAREDQLNMVEAFPGAVEEADWSPQHGWTYAWFEKLSEEQVAMLLRMSYVNVAPKRLTKA